MKPTKAEITEFLKLNLEAAKTQLRGREQQVATWSEGDDAHWKEVAMETGGKIYKKAERVKIAEREARIANKIRREVVLFSAAIEAMDYDHSVWIRESLELMSLT